MEAMKFLFTSSFYPPRHIGGDAVHVQYLARELVARGHEVHVMHSLDAYNLKKTFEIQEVQQDDGVYVHPTKSQYGILSPVSAHAIGKSPSVSRKFQKIVNEISPDVVHHHNISLMGIDILQKIGRYINLYTAHDYWLLCPRNDLLFKGSQICHHNSCFTCGLYSGRFTQPWRNRKNMDKKLTQLDRIFAPSMNLKSLINQVFDVKVKVIYNFAPLPPIDKISIQQSDYFLFVGTLEEHKGVKVLLNAFKELNNGRKLVMVGDGSLRKYIEDEIDKNGVNDKIRMLGHINHERLYELYKNAIALVLPSICYENCPLSVLEAFSVGTPVIGSNNGGISEIIQLSNSGQVFDSKSKYLRERMQNISDNPKLRNELSQNALQAYSRWFSPGVFLKSYEEEIALINIM